LPPGPGPVVVSVLAGRLIGQPGAQEISTWSDGQCHCGDIKERLS
jgi:hypothetical protein